MTRNFFKQQKTATYLPFKMLLLTALM